MIYLYIIEEKRYSYGFFCVWQKLNIKKTRLIFSLCDNFGGQCICGTDLGANNFKIRKFPK
jgi:hypothetical protein